MFTNSDKENMPYKKECMWFYPNQVSCDTLAIHLACLHCATHGNLAQYFSLSVSMRCLFGCHLCNHAETITLLPFCSQQGEALPLCVGIP